MACTGMTWDAVLDELDLPRLQAINDYWIEHPPAHILIAMYLGIKPKEKQSSNPAAEISPGDMQKLIEMMPSAPAPVFMSSDEYKRKRAEQFNTEGNPDE
jgi:ABC-type Zn uptake system ZnuABC Zn-binding protein ZnuA